MADLPLMGLTPTPPVSSALRSIGLNPADYGLAPSPPPPPMSSPLLTIIGLNPADYGLAPPPPPSQPDSLLQSLGLDIGGVAPPPPLKPSSLLEGLGLGTVGPGSLPLPSSQPGSQLNAPLQTVGLDPASFGLTPQTSPQNPPPPLDPLLQALGLGTPGGLGGPQPQPPSPPGSQISAPQQAFGLNLADFGLTPPTPPQAPSLPFESLLQSLGPGTPGGLGSLAQPPSQLGPLLEALGLTTPVAPMPHQAGTPPN